MTAILGIAVVALTACFLGALLHFGVFGSFGAGWFTVVLANMHKCGSPFCA